MPLDALGKAQPCQYLDFGLLASGAVLSHEAGRNLLHQFQEMNTVGNQDSLTLVEFTSERCNLKELYLRDEQNVNVTYNEK